MRYLSFDLSTAKEEPALVFDHPREVLCVVNLRDEERLDILENWRSTLMEDFPQTVELTDRIAEIDRAIDEILSDPSLMKLPLVAPGEAAAAHQ
jgi:hypothetical protein